MGLQDRPCPQYGPAARRSPWGDVSRSWEERRQLQQRAMVVLSFRRIPRNEDKKDPVWTDEKVPELDSRDGCTMLMSCHFIFLFFRS